MHFPILMHLAYNAVSLLSVLQFAMIAPEHVVVHSASSLFILQFAMIAFLPLYMCG